MCGIVKLWSANAKCSELEDQLLRATTRIGHRGPDDSGTWIAEKSGVGLGHIRLSIIDPTDFARQPMFDSSGRYALVFNGEIYNYRELFEKYCPADGSVNSKSDTAVLLHLLMTHGADCLQYLDGMFAFAFLDVIENTFLLARDRFGDKLLYWLHSNETFAFSSELVGLRSLLPERDWSLDQSAVHLFHTMGGIPAPHTIFDGVHALEAGCWLTWRRGSCPESRSYWNLQNSVWVGRESDFCTTTALQKAIDSRMVSDVPVGVFLSGGIGSSSILATACAQDSHPDLSLCVDFPKAEYSEFPVANALANHFNVPIRRHALTRQMFTSGKSDFLAAMNQPTFDGFNTYFLSIAAAETGIKVWLSGIGRDELFGGYPSFGRMRNLQRVARVFQKIIPDRLAFSAAAAIRTFKPARVLNLAVSGDPATRAYQVCRQILLTAKLRELLVGADRKPTADLQAEVDSTYRFAKQDDRLDYFQKASLFESHAYMRSPLLRDIDNFTMAKSLEVRAPFLDHELFAAVWRLPSGKKDYNDTLKPLLIDSVPSGLPDVVPVNQKHRFTFPIEKWAREGMATEFRDVVQDSVNADIRCSRQIEKLWAGHAAGAVHWSVLWMLYSFAKWREMHAC